MSNTNEHIEARLAAYIDGECSPAERIEIEKYLAGNPAHRQLIDDLMGIKSKVAQLPRESAPAEVLDYLQTNLERHALLEDVEQSAGSMHINRWPQFAAIAAVLLLTVGLGSLVYLVLPRNEFNRDQIVLAPPAIQKLPGSPSLAEATLEDKKAADADRAVDNKSLAAVTNPDAAPKADIVSKGETTSNFNAATTSIVASNNGPITLNNGSAIVVQTDDLLLTQNLVAGYLGQNQYQFTPVNGDAVNNRGLLANAVPPATINSGATVIQEAGEMVEKLKQQQNLQSERSDRESYLLVRNVSSAKAAELSRALGDQRGDRQQARFYSNSVINNSNSLSNNITPINNTQVQGGFGGGVSQVSGVVTKDEASQAASNAAMQDNMGSKNIPDVAREKQIEPTLQMSKGIVEPVAESKAIPGVNAAGIDKESVVASKPVPATAPAEGIENQPEQPTDVLIIVQAVPVIPSTQPTTQPTTQPATQPSTQPAVEPISIQTPTTQPAATQPVEVPIIDIKK